MFSNASDRNLNCNVLMPVFLHCSDTVGWATGRDPACKKLAVDLLMITIWSFACLIAPVVTTNSVILSCNKI